MKPVEIQEAKPYTALLRELRPFEAVKSTSHVYVKLDEDTVLSLPLVACNGSTSGRVAIFPQEPMQRLTPGTKLVITVS